MDELCAPILRSSYTKADVYHRLQLAREFAEYELYRAHEGGDIGERLDQFLADRNVDTETREAMRAWGAEVWQELTGTDADTVLDEIANTVQGLPVVVLYLAVRLSGEHVAPFARQIRSWYHSHALLSIQVREEILAGCAISVGDHYYDYTLRGHFLSHRDNLRESIQQFIADRISS
jgi:hypothetical protein